MFANPTGIAIDENDRMICVADQRNG